MSGVVIIPRIQLCIVFALFVAMSISPACATTYVVFRYDDFAGDEPNVREINELRQRVWQAEQQADEVFTRSRLQYVIAIIPQPDSNYAGVGSGGGRITLEADSEKIRLIRQSVQEGRIEVAQHGLSHTQHCASGHRPAEFRERGYQLQLDDIIEGRNILMRACGLSEITTFVPPWNGWDHHTAEALVNAGFKELSADRYYCYKSASGLAIVPFTTTLQGIEPLILQGQLTNPGVYVVLYHPFDLVKFQGENAQYYFGVERFKNLIEHISKMPEVKVTTLKNLCLFEDVGFERYAAANTLWKQMSFWSKLLPLRLWPGTVNSSLYLSTEVYRRQARFWNSMVVLLAGGLLIAGLAARWVVGLVLSPKWRLWMDIAGSLLFFAGILSEIYLMYRGYHPAGIRAIPVFFAVSFFIALAMRAGSFLMPGSGSRSQK